MKPSKNIKSIKIIGGAYRGKILHALPLSHTRPTKAIIKESIFNTIQSDVCGSVFVEVFAGFGSIGCEAFSRGAREVIFIEQDAQTFAILKQNLAMLSANISYSLSGETSQILALNGDSFELLPLILACKKIDILYFDPPFGEAYYARCFGLVENLSHHMQKALIIFEHDSKFEIPACIADKTLQKTRAFGRSAVSYYA